MRQAQEREFHSFDQVPLFYRYWAGTTATPATRAIVLLHRGHEHSGRVTHLVDELDLPDTAFFAWDAGVKRGNIQLLGTLSYAAPLASTLWLVLAGRAQASATLGIAAALITAGAALAAAGGRRRRAR